MIRNNIILIGYMGCGKTTVGKNLARITGYTFTDTDEMIEKEQGGQSAKSLPRMERKLFARWRQSFWNSLSRNRAHSL